VPPSSTMAHLAQMLDQLDASEPRGETNLGPVIELLAAQIKRRGVVMLISDCFDDPERLLAGLRLMRHRRQDVRVFQILDPAEAGLPLGGVIEFQGCEGEPKLMLDADRIRQHYREAFAAHQRHLAEGCHAMQVPLETITTDQDLALALVRALQGPVGAPR
jgi:uncharacterized protein (DUF58 family)